MRQRCPGRGALTFRCAARLDAAIVSFLEGQVRPILSFLEGQAPLPRRVDLTAGNDAGSSQGGAMRCCPRRATSRRSDSRDPWAASCPACILRTCGAIRSSRSTSSTLTVHCCAKPAAHRRGAVSQADGSAALRRGAAARRARSPPPRPCQMTDLGGRYRPISAQSICSPMSPVVATITTCSLRRSCGIHSVAAFAAWRCPSSSRSSGPRVAPRTSRRSRSWRSCSTSHSADVQGGGSTATRGE